MFDLAGREIPPHRPEGRARLYPITDVGARTAYMRKAAGQRINDLIVAIKSLGEQDLARVVSALNKLLEVKS